MVAYDEAIPLASVLGMAENLVRLAWTFHLFILPKGMLPLLVLVQSLSFCQSPMKHIGLL